MDSDSQLNLRVYPDKVQQSLNEAIAFQQNLYELSSDWLYYESDQHEYLKENIRYSLFGASETDALSTNIDVYTGDPVPTELLPEQAKLIDMIYSRILEVSRCRNSLHVGIIFNVLCNLKEKEDKYVAPVPVFKVKRCMERKESLKTGPHAPISNNTIGGTALYPYCVNYIDSEGRIYQNWTDYVTNNTLPKCMMVLPMGGYYQANPHVNNTADMTYVWVEIGPSPGAAKILSCLDVASAILGIGALGIGAAALAAPAIIAAPVVLTGSVCGAVSGVCTMVRSGQQLADRHQHQQSISVMDGTARSAWFGVVGGVAGGLASGSTMILNKAVRAGLTIGTAGRTTFNVITIGNIVINGMGIGNGIYNIYINYHNKKEISVLDVTQVIAHVLFFGNAVINFHTAKTIINNTQQQVLQDYEQSLRSNRHKKAFRQIRRNTQACSGDQITGDSEIIRGIRSIQNKDDFFAGVVRNNKVFRSSNAEVTFKDGHAMINHNVKFDPIDLSQQTQQVRVNTVRAVDPFHVSRSTIPSPNRMPVANYVRQLGLIRESFKPFTYYASFPISFESMNYIGKLVIDMQNFSDIGCTNLITNLANIAQHILRKSKEFAKESMDKLMYDIWIGYVRPKVENLFADLGIDASHMDRCDNLAEFFFDTAREIIEDIYNEIDNFLEEIKVSFLRSSQLQSEAAVCRICSGHLLSD
ncbi:uncharacterized protein LOC124297998 [Neodiprion virginianus]|uniref:uncharacterized protein LOC124297998 n=1 Tax=Neodiprion virginianus TaxID=2961670 RepID=UPI001EE6F1EC|nr:uncharacterized protein LOC124297998 [Neodiprion virginianus]